MCNCDMMSLFLKTFMDFIFLKTLKTSGDPARGYTINYDTLFNQEKFQYISYHMGDSSKINNIYLSPDHNILPKSGEVKDLGILMSENCDFDSHIASVAKKCSRLCGWILRTFSTRSKSVLLTLFKSIVLPHLDYRSQLWSPYKAKNINALEKVQRVFTKHIERRHNLSYTERQKPEGTTNLLTPKTTRQIYGHLRMEDSGRKRPQLLTSY